MAHCEGKHGIIGLTKSASLPLKELRLENLTHLS